MKKFAFISLILVTIIVSGCSQGEQKTTEVNSQSQQSQQSNGQKQPTLPPGKRGSLKNEKVEILPTDKPIEVDLSTVYDATAPRSETQQ